MKISHLATAALFASVLATSAAVTADPAQPALDAALGSTKTVKLTVTGTESWTISDSGDWLSLSTVGGAAGTHNIVLTALTANSTGSRSAEVTVKVGPTATPTETFVFVVVQSADASLAATTTTTLTDDVAAPTLTITAGSTKSVYQKAVISGTAVDTAGTTPTGTTAVISGVQQVYWRDEGSSKWRKAMMGGRGTANATWFINATLKKKAGRRIYIKAVDGAGNESMITDRFKWDTTGTAATTTPTTNTTTVSTGG